LVRCGGQGQALPLLLEQLIKRFPYIVAIHSLRPTARRQRHAIVWLEEIAEISFDLILHIFCCRLAALVVLPRIKKAAVLAAVNVRRAMWTLIRAGKLANDSDLASAIMTNH